MKNVKVPLVVLVFLIVTAAGLGIHRVYVHQRVEGPLADMALDLEGVDSIELVKTISGKRDVYVRFDPDAPLEIVYPEVLSAARHSLGAMMGRLIVVDQRNPLLDEAYHKIHFAVQEGISTGRFTQMEAEIDRRLQSFPINDARVTVSHDHVYVQLVDGDDYLVSIVPRGADRDIPSQWGER